MSSSAPKQLPAWLILPAAFLFAGCFESPNGLSNNGDGDTLTVPSTYAFLGGNGQSSVDYGGQTVRNLLITDIQSAARVSSAKAIPVDSILKYYTHVDADSLDIRTSLSNTAPVSAKLHAKYARIAGGRSLHDKVSPDTVIGYGVTTDSLVRLWAAQIAANSQDAGKRGSFLAYTDSNGVDLSQMISKTLAGAVAYYQATAVYLQSVPSRDNTAYGINNYTAMEHGWDEAFGYFGAARDYATNYTDDDLNTSSPPGFFKDSDQDGNIDFRSEYNFSMMGRYTGRRDRGLDQDWSGDVFAAFRKGRAFISAKGSIDTILAQRAIIAGNGSAAGIWEKTFAANTISYIKNVKAILDTATGLSSSLGGNWSEMKAFALCLQFNPYKKASNAELAQLQALLGKGPVLDAGRAAYVAKLDSAKALVQSIYGFSNAQVDAESWK